MSLSDIKFKYLDKIQTIDNRIERYNSIIEDYDKRIKRAEKEEKQNISSVLKAKSDYVKRIENLSLIKADYQEFVDTSDKLIQNINKDGYSLLNLKYEQLMDKNQSLIDDNEELKTLLDNKENDLKRYKTANENNKRKLMKLKKDYEKRMGEINNYKSRIIAKDSAYSSLRDKKSQGKTEIRKLSIKNKQLQSTNEFLESRNEVLERRVQELEDYCNYQKDLLLNRRENELPTSISNKNIFKQLVEGQ